jgi:2'-5' RNA ligase
VKGLGTFNDRVLWAGIEAGDVLQKMAKCLHDALVKHGVLHDQEFAFEAHITVCKTS